MLNGIQHLTEPNGLPAFARANGWAYAPTAEVPALGASLWEQVSNGSVRDRVSGSGWEAGRIVGGDRTASRVEQRGRWTVTTRVSVSAPERSIDLGYFAITLPRKLPNFVLDADRNDRGPFSSLLNRPRSSQRLPLEGDFDSHFRLYAPKGYERDALYVFTPDLMALLIDETGDLDVEVRDDRFIVTKPGGFDFRSPATWERLGHILDTVGAKTRTRTDMYADERVVGGALQSAGPSSAEVAPAGQRLKRVPFGGLRGSAPALIGAGIGLLAALAGAGVAVWAALTQ